MTQTVPSLATHLVVVGASAGGLRALESFVSGLPPSTPLAFVVVQHLSPTHASMMAELLQRRCVLQVSTARDGERIEAGRVFCMPHDSDLEVRGDRLALVERSLDVPRLPIDRCMISAAQAWGERSVAVVLSGGGTDGTRGVRAVGDAGGLVLVQARSEAEFDGMPRSAESTGLADMVAPTIDLVAHLLVATTQPGPSVESIAPAEPALSQLFELLLSSHGVDFRRYKTSTVLRRLVRRMVMHRLRSLDTYVQLLRADPSELGALAAQLRIGVTAFYRDPQAMSFLGEAVLPPLLDQLPQGETFRAWVAGCSTGEEAYTLALLIEEHGRRRRRRLPYKIFATDIDAASLAIASAGAYAPSVVADLPPELVAQWFSPLDDLLVISPDVRENVVFARHDLLTDPPFTNLHMISCRNVLIYLEPDAQQAVIEQFRYGLHEEGLLFLGPSETPGRASDGFAPLHGTGRLYRSRGRSSARSQPTRRVPRTPSTRANVRAALDQGRIAEALLKGWAGRRAALLLAVNAAQEVLYSVGRHTDLLSVPEGAPDYRLTTMLPRPIGIPALSCAQRVMRTGEAVEYAGIELSHEGQSRSYDLSVVPIGSPTGEHLVGVALHERVASVAPPAEPLPSDLHQELQLQLQHTRESLQSTVEELEAANEELQATNEELLASNEELQATNEELQSVNEELHTVNGEHQLKILELTEKTNDLDNLVRNTRQATLFVDENLDVRLFTEELTAILQIRPVDVGRPASDLVHRLVDEPHPAQTAAEVLHSGRDVEREVRTAQGRTFLMRVLPYRVSARANAGAVLTFVDITRTQRTDRGSEPPVA